jgi:RNA polymerase sigma-70 factor (ECF subfamily)
MRIFLEKPMATAEFIKLLTANQSRVYAYILSLVFDPDQADDVLQQTNTILWEKATEFEMGTNYIAWSFRIAYFQVLAHRKKMQRDRLIFDDDLLLDIARVADQGDETFETRQRLMRVCLERLNERQRDIVRRRYSVGANVEKISTDVGRSITAVKQILFRARRNLINCVNVNMATEAQQ